VPRRHDLPIGLIGLAGRQARTAPALIRPGSRESGAGIRAARRKMPMVGEQYMIERLAICATDEPPRDGGPCSDRSRRTRVILGARAGPSHRHRRQAAQVRLALAGRPRCALHRRVVRAWRASGSAVQGFELACGLRPRPDGRGRAPASSIAAQLTALRDIRQRARSRCSFACSRLAMASVHAAALDGASSAATSSRLRRPRTPRRRVRAR
jgi:hypothetical protein